MATHDGRPGWIEFPSLKTFADSESRHPEKPYMRGTLSADGAFTPGDKEVVSGRAHSELEKLGVRGWIEFPSLAIHSGCEVSHPGSEFLEGIAVADGGFLPDDALPDVPARDRVLNCLPSRIVEDDFKASMAEEAFPVDSASIPDEVDLRQPHWPVWDQRRSGACVGFAVAGALHYYRNAPSAFTAHRAAPRFLWMASKESDPYNKRPTSFIENAGTYIKTALHVAQQYGYVLESDLPMDGGNTQLKEKVFYARAAINRIVAYFQVAVCDWKKWLYQRGPIVGRLRVDGNFRHLYERSKLEEYKEDETYGGHAVVIVGYKKEKGETFYIVRNSWGKAWGEGGYALASTEYCLRAFEQGGYGIVTSP